MNGRLRNVYEQINICSRFIIRSSFGRNVDLIMAQIFAVIYSNKELKAITNAYRLIASIANCTA